MLTYYDPHLGRTRYKRRYIWAFWAFSAGIVVGVVLSVLL